MQEKEFQDSLMLILAKLMVVLFGFFKSSQFLGHFLELFERETPVSVFVIFVHQILPRSTKLSANLEWSYLDVLNAWVDLSSTCLVKKTHNSWHFVHLDVSTSVRVNSVENHLGVFLQSVLVAANRVDIHIVSSPVLVPVAIRISQLVSSRSSVHTRSSMHSWSSWIWSTSG